MIRAELEKWRITIVNCYSRYMAYKLNFFLTLVAPTAVFCFVNYTVWSAIYTFRDDATIAGFSRESMLHYQCWAMVVTLLTRSHRSWNLSEDIRFGRISSFLLYPFAFWKYHFAEFLAFQSLQLVSVVLSVLVLAISGLITPPPVDILLRGILVSALVGVLWYSIEFTMGLLAFWLEEVWVIRVTVQLCAALLSGAFIPLELFPMAIRKAVEFTPFPLLTSIPVKIFMGQETGELAELVALTLLWTTVFGISAALVWRKGTRMYTAAGI